LKSGPAPAGQYLAEVAGLGLLVGPDHIQKTLTSIYRYSHKATLFNHDSVQRTFALNDEAALVICDYGRGECPKIPFPYYAEVMTGFEYSAAVLMLYTGMIERGLECINDIRRRYDGIRRNPWDEAECGHHYARAMASWSGVLALSGFRYNGADRHISARPRVKDPNFKSFWSAGTGWGTFALSQKQGKTRLTLTVIEGSLLARKVELTGSRSGSSSAKLGSDALQHKAQAQNGMLLFTFAEEVKCDPGAGPGCRNRSMPAVIRWLGGLGLATVSSISLIGQSRPPSFDFGLANLPFLTDAQTRSVSAENPTGEKGSGGMAIPNAADSRLPFSKAASDLGQGWKVNPFLKPRHTRL